jgi:protein-S-isoprenylcysteine O-methyltransferase Ste14
VTTIDRLKAQGQRLFAARSVVPLALLPIIAVALPEAWRVASTHSPLVCRIWISASLMAGFAGLTLRVMAVAFAPDGASSRDTHQLRATSLTTTGVYSVVRNPLYLGNALMWLGAVGSLRLWWLVLVTALLYWLYIERVIVVEETFLERTFGERFSDWASRTPAFVPNVSLWRRPAGAFSWRRLATEHNGLLGFLATVAMLRIAVDVVVGGRTWSEWRVEHTGLLGLLGAALVLSLVLIALKRVVARS